MIIGIRTPQEFVRGDARYLLQKIARTRHLLDLSRKRVQSREAELLELEQLLAAYTSSPTGQSPKTKDETK